MKPRCPVPGWNLSEINAILSGPQPARAVFLRGDLQTEDLARPVAVDVRAWTLTVRPASRTLTVRASIHTNVYGPASSGRLRNASTCASRCWAISDTCDLDNCATPSCSTSFSTRRVDTPSR